MFRPGQLALVENTSEEGIIRGFAGDGCWNLILIASRQCMSLRSTELEPATSLIEATDTMTITKRREVLSPVAQVNEMVFFPACVSACRAPRGSTFCVVCNSTIALHSVRVRVEWTHLIAQQVLKDVLFFHATCFDPSCLSPNQTIEGVTGLTYDERTMIVDTPRSKMAWSSPVGTVADKNFRRIHTACRNAVSQQIRAFRNSFWVGPEQGCPFFPDILLNRANSHVHHDGASTTMFSDMCATWWEACGLAIESVKTFRGGFADPELALEFARYHEERAHLRMVSKKANLSYLRVCERFCDFCVSTDDVYYLSEFRLWLCFACRKQDFLCQQDALREFVLTTDDLARISHSKLPNPAYGHRSKGFVPMKIFRRRDVVQLCIEVHGSLGQAAIRRQARDDHRMFVKRKWSLAHETCDRVTRSKSARVTKIRITATLASHSDPAPYDR